MPVRSVNSAWKRAGTPGAERDADAVGAFFGRAGGCDSRIGTIAPST